MRPANTCPNFAAALIAGLGFIAISLPALAEGTQQTGAASIAAAEKPVVPKRPSMVQLTNTSNGEVGCHNETTQTSEPGPCPWPKP